MSVEGWGSSIASSPALTGQYSSRTWFLSSTAPHGRFPTDRRDLLSQAEGMILHPRPVVETVGVAPEGNLAWDLAVVLETLCRLPFEPIEEISDRHLTLKLNFFCQFLLLRELGICRPFLCGLLISWLCATVWPKLFRTLVRGMSLRSPPLHHGLSYCRFSVLLPSGSLTSRGLIVLFSASAGHIRPQSCPVEKGGPTVRLPMVPLREGNPASKQTLSRWIVDGHYYCLWFLWSPLTIGGQGSLNQECGGL